MRVSRSSDWGLLRVVKLLATHTKEERAALRAFCVETAFSGQHSQTVLRRATQKPATAGKPNKWLLLCRVLPLLVVPTGHKWKARAPGYFLLIP